MGPLLLTSGLALVVLAVIATLAGDGAEHNEHSDNEHSDNEHGYNEHSHNEQPGRQSEPERSANAPSVGPGWLLLVPVIALFVVSPRPLGSWGLNHTGASSAGADRNWSALPVGAGPVPLRVREVVGRANAGGATLRGRTVLIEGFVVRRSGGLGIARYSIACCAADAQAAQVLVRFEGVTPSLPPDSWVRVVADFTVVRGDDVELRARSFETIPSPPEPFE